jgi:hypothetical protein
MAELAAKVSVLVVQMWVHDLKEIRAALQEAGLTATITRVDLEPALGAALEWGDFDVVIYDARTTAISREALIDCLRVRGRNTPIVDLGDVATLGTRVRGALVRHN